MSGVQSLYKAPKVNPITQKAESIPAFNPINVYGRVFNFSWFGFFIAFWAWYAFPPLLNDVVAKDIGASKTTVLNSNIVALVATLLVRLVAGPLCDRFGPRKTFAGILLVGAIPSFCAGGVKNGTGLLAVRFFIGILGGSFVPCQVWTTQFFDKRVVGTANALTAGLGNSGGGVTYFVMPAVYTSLKSSGLTSSTAWRVSFVVPSILITVTAIAMLLLCPDTPTGKWSDRHLHVEQALQKHSMVGTVDVPGQITTEKGDTSTVGVDTPPSETEKKEAIIPPSADPENFAPNEAHLSAEDMMDTAKGEVIRKPTPKEIFQVIFSPQTLVVGACYFCSFGAELSINSTLGTYYKTNFKTFSLQQAGNWAAMFGLLNVVFRPLGGFVADLVYKYTGTVWGKKGLLHAYGIIQGAFLVAIGVLNPKNQSTMFGLIAGMAFFLEGGNGINFANVPHVHPYANGVVSGFTGGMGNFGGVIFAIIFRYAGTTKAFWILGIIAMVVNAAVSWIPPVPKGQKAMR